jgi:hypothetical protein
METNGGRIQGRDKRERDRRDQGARAPADIEIAHRRSPQGDAEQISINLQAVPSFEAFGASSRPPTPLRFGRRPPA